MLIHVPADSPPPEELEFDQRWGTIDRALVTCWLRGRALRTEQGWQETARRAAAGELPSIIFDGGSDGPSKPGAKRTGVLQYLAIWQGIRGEDLKIDTEAATTLTCSGTGAVVTFRLTPITDPGANRTGAELSGSTPRDNHAPARETQHTATAPQEDVSASGGAEPNATAGRPREGQSALF